MPPRTRKESPKPAVVEAKPAAAKKKPAARKTRATRSRGAQRPKSEQNPKHPTVAETVARNQQIVYDKDVNLLSWTAIVQKHKVTEKTAREGYKMYVDEIAPLIDAEGALDKAREFIRKLEGIQERAAAIAANEKVGEATRLQALRDVVATMQKEIDLRRAVGLFPRHLGDLAEIAERRYVSERLVGVFERIDAPQDAYEELMEILEAAAPARLTGP